MENIEKDSNVDEVENYSPLPSRSRLVKGRTFTSLPLNSLETRSTIENQIVAALQRKALKKETELQESSFLQSIQKSESSVYIKILIWACILMSLWKNSWLWPLIIILILVYFVKAIANFFGIGNFLFNITGNIKNDLYIWFNDR